MVKPIGLGARYAAVVTLLVVIGGIAGADDVAIELHGRGVHYFDGSVRCPLAGVGRRGDYACNRVALDDDFTSVRVDPATHRIVLRNTHSYSQRQVIGDLLVVASGETAAGVRAPVGVHLKIEKRDNRFITSMHPHPTVREAIVSAQYDPYTVVVSDGAHDTVVATGDQILRAIREPELTARLANIFIQVTDNLEGEAIKPAQPNAHLVDLAIGVGAKQLNLKVARIELLSLDPANAPLIEAGAVAEMFRRGAWELRITSLTPFLPREEFDRDFFLLGIDQLPVVRPVIERGLRQGETLVVGYRDGRGFVGVGDQRNEIPDPVEVARAYMEFNFVGGLLAHQLQQVPSKLH